MNGARIFALCGSMLCLVHCGGQAFSDPGDDDDAGTAGSDGSGANGGSGGSGGTGAVGGAGGSGGSGGSGGVAGGGNTPNSRDCSVDADCGVGMRCFELVPGGFRVCGSTPIASEACTGSTLDECCTSAECGFTEGGGCFKTPVHPYCGGAMPQDYNTCARNECESVADCTATFGENAICVPAGALGHKVNGCIGGGCRLDTDCTFAPGGICAPVSDPCCGTAALYCVYPNVGCRTSSDCTTGTYCGVQGDKATCLPGYPTCPA